MRRAFTLVELLAVIAIMGAMVTVGILSLSAGQGAVRVRGATRDVLAVVRHARSLALVTQKPVVVTYSTVSEDGESVAKIEFTSAEIMNTRGRREAVETLAGQPVAGAEAAKEGEDAAAGGETVEEILFAPISTDVVKGMCLKVEMGDEEAETMGAARKSKVSVYSNVDYLLGRYQTARAENMKKKKEAAEEAGKTASAESELQAEKSVIWETNGRIEPHRIWVYPSGAKPENGLCLRVDRFGAVKVLDGEGREAE